MSNRKTGTAFEKELCEYLGKHGFWAHNLAQSAAGQPFDVIAVRHGIAYPIDCKVCENDVFPFSRIEENQRMAMEKWIKAGNGDTWFALKLSDGEVYMVPYGVFRWAETYHHEKSMDRDDIEDLGYPLKLEDWV